LRINSIFPRFTPTRRMRKSSPSGLFLTDVESRAKRMSRRPPDYGLRFIRNRVASLRTSSLLDCESHEVTALHARSSRGESGAG
jgi:hypothetical protein